jgi:hypothetical protein
MFVCFGGRVGTGAIFFFFLFVFRISLCFECKYETLPLSFDGPGYLEFDNDLHIHNKFRVEFDKPIAPINFTLSEISIVRMYIAPHDVEITLKLFKDLSNPNPLVAVSDSLIETTVLATLSPGKYFFSILHDVGAVQIDECMTLMMEVAITPLRVHNQHKTAALSDGRCKSEQTLPPDDLFDDATYGGSVIINPETSYEYYPPNVDTNFTIIQQYNISIPTLIGRQNLWSFKSTLHMDFLTGGSMGMSLTPFSHSSSMLKNCKKESKCTIGRSLLMNSKSIRELIGPGDYILWLYDISYVRDDLLLPCSPFTLKVDLEHVDEDEDFVNCNLPRLPSTFDSPGYLDHGHLHYYETVFLDVGIPKTVKFTVQNESFFRAFVAENNVDIDLSLKSVDLHHPINLWSNRFKGEEAIQTFLQPGSYLLTYSFYSSSAIDFCQSFETQVAVAPALSITDDYCNPTRVDPDFSGLQNIRDGLIWSIDRTSSATVYYYPYQGNFSSRNFISVPFTLSVRSKFELIVYSNFLLGDMSITLVYHTTKGSVIKYGLHRRNRIDLSEFLDAGEYEIHFRTAIRETRSSTGSVSDNLVASNFPSCIKYEVEAHVVPEENLNSAYKAFVFPDMQTCPHRRLPTDANSVEFLGVSGRMQIQEAFRIQFLKSIAFEEENMYLMTGKDVLVFRLYAEPHYHDIDFYLYEVNGKQDTKVQQSTSYLDEEKLFLVLKVHTTYRLKMTVARTQGHDITGCQYFNLEMAIFPFLSGESLSNCTSIIPTWDKITTSSTVTSTKSENIKNQKRDLQRSLSYEVSENLKETVKQKVHSPRSEQSQLYQFPQTSQTFSSLISFHLNEPSYITVLLSYDFLWNDLSLKILNMDKESLDGASTVAFGSHKYNVNQIQSAVLGSGDYAIDLFEPSVVDESLRRCANFDLHIWTKPAQNVTDHIDKEMLLGCEDSFLPATWNSDGFLSSLSGNSLHLQYSVLANVKKRVERVVFTISERSIFRVYIPPHPTIDVDIRLLKGSPQSPGGIVEASLTIGDEESILQVLEPGPYFFQVNFLTLVGAGKMPTMDECPSFPMEVAIVPSSYIPKSLEEHCESQPLLLVFNQEMDLTLKLEHGKSHFKVSFPSFKIEKVGSIRFELNFDFVTASTQIILNGTLQNGHTILKYGMLSLNHRTLEEVLEAGTYTIIIHEPFGKNSGYLKHVNCRIIRIHYFIQLDGTPPLYLCPETDNFPTDLFSQLGIVQFEIFLFLLYWSRSS